MHTLSHCDIRTPDPQNPPQNSERGPSRIRGDVPASKLVTRGSQDGWRLHQVAALPCDQPLAQRTNKSLPVFQASLLPVILTPFLPPLQGSASLVCPPFPEPPVSFCFFSSLPQKHPDLSRLENRTETSLSQSDPPLDLPLLPSKLHLEELGWPCPPPNPLTLTPSLSPSRLQTLRVQRPLTCVPWLTAHIRPNQRT